MVGRLTAIRLYRHKKKKIKICKVSETLPVIDSYGSSKKVGGRTVPKVLSTYVYVPNAGFQWRTWTRVGTSVGIVCDMVCAHVTPLYVSFYVSSPNPPNPP